MKKNDKKIISIFLVLIILISQFSTIIFAEEDATNLISLEQYLVDNGVDKDGDKKLSDEEWKSVKNLEFNGDIADITGLENATNLKRLYIKSADLSGMNLGNFKKLKELKLYNCILENTVISGIDKLISIYISSSNLNDCKIENLKSIEKIHFDYCNMSDFDFSKMKNVKEISLYPKYENIKMDLDLTAFENLEILTIMDYSKVINNLNILGLSNLKELNLYHTYNSNIELSELKNVEEIYIDNNKIEQIDFTSYENLKKLTVGKNDEKINKDDVKISEEFIALYEGGVHSEDYIELEKKEKIIKMAKGGMLENTKESWKNNLVIVPESDVLESDILDVDFENNHIIGENIGEQKIKVIDVLGREHELLIRVEENNVNTDLENSGITAQSINYDMILKSNGELWKINSSTTAEMIDTNVKKYISNSIYDGMIDIIVLNTLYNENKLVVEYIENNKKIINNVKDIGYWSYVTTDGNLYEYRIEEITEEFKTKYVMDNVKEIVNGRFIILENGKILEKCGNGEYVEKKEVDNLIKSKYGNQLALSKNKTAHLIGWNEERETEEAILNAPLVLTNVDEITIRTIDVDCLIRTDGTIWLYDLRNGLTKITESTPSNPEKEEKLKIDFEDVLEEQEIISNINSGTTINDLIEKIQTNGKIKLYTKDGVLIETNEKLATGMKLEISLGNEKLVYIISITGDSNGDGKVRVGDLTTMMVSVAENLASNKDTSKILEGVWKQSVDLNGDGKLNVSDITKLKILIAESK